jgi:DNA repair ATPase RecN
MITRITLTNYMSHAHTVIEPAAGLTVILGPNNCGKSAIVSALQTLCGDNSGDFMVRHGEKECAVTVETDDGHTITWRRGKKAGYVLNGVEVTRVGRGNLPDDLQTFLRLGKVPHPSKDEEFDVHFGEQKSPIFLIDKQADTAAFFSTASDAEKLLEMQKLHKSKATDRRRQLAETKSELEILGALLNALSPLDALGLELESLSTEEKELDRVDQQIVALEELLNQICQQEEFVQFQQRKVAAMLPLKSPPALDDADSLESLAALLEHTAANVAFHRQSTAVLSSLAPAPELHDIAPLARHLESITKAHQSFEHASARASACATLAPPPIPQDTTLLEELHRRLRIAAASASAASARQTVLAQLASPPPADDPAPLASLLDRLAAANNSRLKQHHELDLLLAQMKTIEADIAAWLWANPNCPTCGQPTTREHFLTSHSLRPQPLAQGETHA